MLAIKSGTRYRLKNTLLKTNDKKSQMHSDLKAIYKNSLWKQAIFFLLRFPPQFFIPSSFLNFPLHNFNISLNFLFPPTQFKYFPSILLFSLLLLILLYIFYYIFPYIGVWSNVHTQQWDLYRTKVNTTFCTYWYYLQWFSTPIT